MKSLAIASLLLLPAQDEAATKRLEALAGKDARAAWEASGELCRSIDPALLPEVLRVFKSVPPRSAGPVTRVLECLAGPDLVPELLELLAKEPARAPSVANVLEMLADPRAEAALLPLLSPERRDAAYAVAGALGTCGGKDSIEALRKRRSEFGDPKFEDSCLRELVGLRDPAAARDVLEAARAGRIELRNWKGDLARLGDRGIVPDLVALIRDPATKIEPRKAALELVGILGTEEQVPFLIEFLPDRRYAEAAAAGLEARADPRATGPLARSLQGAVWGGPFVRAILAAPSPEAEAPIFEMLDDREGYPRTSFDAARVAVRLGTPKLKAKLVDLLAQGWLDLELALATAALLEPADLERLRKSRGIYVPLALAARGDPDGLKKYVADVAERRVQDIVVRQRRGTNVQPTRGALEIFRTPPPGLLAAVHEEFGRRPEWTAGAEFLALHGNDAGRKRLLEEFGKDSGRDKDRLARALLGIGERAAVQHLLKAYEIYREDEEEERRIAKAMSDEDAAAVREFLRSGKRAYFQGLLRILAFRDDREAIPLFRRELRSRSADAHSTGPLAIALARMKDAESAHVFRRGLRDLVPARRAHAARCLGLLGDKSAIPALAPLLDDLEPQRPPDASAKEVERIPRVCDAAAEAIGFLAGIPLEGTPEERVRAARAAAR